MADLSRRGLLRGLGVVAALSLVVSPAVVRVANIMPVRVFRPRLWGDGIHDDTMALQWLIDNTDGPLVIPEGIYRVPSLITLSDHTTIDGRNALFMGLEGDKSALTVKAEGKAWLRACTIKAPPGVDTYALSVEDGAGMLSVTDCSLHTAHRRPGFCLDVPGYKLSANRSDSSGGQGTSNVVGIMVRHDWGWPREAVSAVGPDPSQDAAGACLKSPFFDEVRHRATYDLNKELFDDLEGGLTIVVGRGYSK